MPVGDSVLLFFFLFSSGEQDRQSMQMRIPERDDVHGTRERDVKQGIERVIGIRISITNTPTVLLLTVRDEESDMTVNEFVCVSFISLGNVCFCMVAIVECLSFVAFLLYIFL